MPRIDRGSEPRLIAKRSCGNDITYQTLREHDKRANSRFITTAAQAVLALTPTLSPRARERAREREEPADHRIKPLEHGEGGRRAQGEGFLLRSGGKLGSACSGFRPCINREQPQFAGMMRVVPLLCAMAVLVPAVCAGQESAPDYAAIARRLDRQRPEIAPPLGATVYTLDHRRLLDQPGDENRSLGASLPQLPGVSVGPNGQVSVRGQ